MSAASEQAVPQTRALVPLGQSQRSMALTRDIVEGILVGMLPYGQIVYKRAKGQKGKDSKKTEVRTDAQRAELIESLIVRHPDNPHVPFLSTVNWSGKPERFGKVVVPVLKDGKPQRNEDGTPKIKLIDQVDLLVSGHSDLPVPGATGDARKTRVTTQVYPLIVCDGAGKMLPYGDTKVQGGSAVFIGVDNMLCFFLYDIEPFHAWPARRGPP